MSSTTNTSPGGSLVASGSIVHQDVLLVSSGATDTFFLPNLVSASLATLTQTATNLPTLLFYLFLEPEYTDPATSTLYSSQLGVTWQPLMNISSAAMPSNDGAELVSMPLAAQMILPINTPIYYRVRVPTSNIGLRIMTPAIMGTTYNRIHFVLAASQ